MAALAADFDVLEFTLGRASALDPQDLIDAAGVVALEVLERAERQLGMPSDARGLLKHLMLIWSRAVVHGSPDDVRKVETTVDDVLARSGWARQQVEVSLGVLSDHLPVHRRGCPEVIVIDLTAFLPRQDPLLQRLFVDDWGRRQVDVHRGVCLAAVHEIHEALADAPSPDGYGEAVDALCEDLALWERRYGAFLEGDEKIRADPILVHAYKAFWALRPIHEQADRHLHGRLCQMSLP